MHKSEEHPNDIIEIGQNTEMSSSDLWRLVTQTSVRNHKLTLKGVNNMHKSEEKLWRMSRINMCVILWYKQITQSRPECKTK